ncbi:hypothetical protein BDR06DRAFT_951656 [Suillus hirtellus]|nr:hypothetical protein BDR06DRAFT_951656 [Suillus hirtellus]
MQSQKIDPKSVSPHSLTRLVYCRTWFQAVPTNHHDRALHARQTSILARRSLRWEHNKYLAGLFVALSFLNLCLLEARYIQPLQKYTLFDSLSSPNLLQLEARYVWPHVESIAFLAWLHCLLKTWFLALE